jgi:lysophospholipase L1-like esterase
LTATPGFALFANSIEPGIKAEWYMDEMHLDAAGNQAIAQIIANKIVADGLLR